MPRFNYIITIHNKEKLIEQVIMAVLMCCRDNSFIYPVLDGCTDNTERIIDSIIERYQNVPIKKVYANNVHELLSINTALRAANHDGEGYNIILQDDVILADYLLEKKVIDLYKWAGNNLGYVSFRMGANLTEDASNTSNITPLKDYLENAYGHGYPEATMILPGQFAYRDLPIKSPVCISFKLIREVGLLEEKLAPYGYDDLDYAIRCYQKNFNNGVFPIKFISEIEWGGTREKKHGSVGPTMTKNLKKIQQWHFDTLNKIVQTTKQIAPISVPNTAFIEEIEKAKVTWQKNQEHLEKYQQRINSNKSIVTVLKNKFFHE